MELCNYLYGVNNNVCKSCKIHCIFTCGVANSFMDFNWHLNIIARLQRIFGLKIVGSILLSF